MGAGGASWSGHRLFTQSLNQSIITATQIQSVSDEIARKFQPERIILFGSYAYGTPTEDSDVDLLVVMPFEGKSVHKASEIEGALQPSFAMDPTVHTPKRLQERLAMNDFFLREITEKGKTLYAAGRYGN